MGSINATGALTIEATATVEDNSLAKVVRIVEDAQQRKGTRQRLADRIARPLVPAIMVLAAVIAGVGALLVDPATWIERALVVLVAAAPTVPSTCSSARARQGDRSARRLAAEPVHVCATGDGSSAAGVSASGRVFSVRVSGYPVLAGRWVDDC